jgi:hypothetical protein
MSTNKKFRIQNGVDVADGGISINDVTVIGADGKVVPAAIADAVAGLTSSDIADLQAQVSAILGTSPETLDTLQEIVAAFEGADSTLTGSVAQNASDIVTINNTLTNGVATPADIATLTASVTAEETRATAAESANAAAIAAANARTSGISTSSGSTDIQMTAEVDMDSNKVTNMADPTAAQDAATMAYVDAGDSASVSTAAADATSKADAAEASAKAYADQVVAATVDAAPAALDTLNELAAALGDDANFASTVTASIATKADDAATTAALDLKEDKTVVADLGTFIKGGDEGFAEILNTGLTVTSSGSGFNYFPDHTGLETGVQYRLAADIVPESGHTNTGNANLTIKVNGSTVATVSEGPDGGSGWDLFTLSSPATSMELIFHKSNADKWRAPSITIVTEGLSGEETLDTTATQVVPAINEVHSELDALAATQSGDTSSLTTAIATAKSEAISTAATDATTKADAAEASAKAHADAGDASLQGQIDIIVGSSPASLDTLQEIVSAFENADSTLTGAVAQNSTDIVAEASRATTAESGLQAQITSNDVDIASLQSLVADLDSDKTSDMTAETAARIAGDVANSAEVATEKSRAEGAEASLANDINVETARAVAVEGSLQSQIDAEQSSRIGGDQLLQNAIDAEEVARIAADAVLQANIDAEASARAGADNTLQSNIDTVSSAVSAITNGSPETLNQLTELVAAYEGADASLQTLIDNLGGDASALTGRVSTLESEMDATETATSSNASAITAEQVARSAADDDLQDAIDAEASARAAAVSAETTARQNAITAEANARILADNGLQSQIDALDNSTTGDKSDLQAQITSNDNDIAALQSRAGTIEADYATQASLNTEISRASSAEAVNAAAISDEQTRATAAEQSNAAAITQEILDRQSADAVLQSQIDFIEENTDPAALDSLTEIVSAFQSADSSTLGVVNSNTGRISALESGVVAIEAWDTDNVSEGSVNLYFTESRAKACVGADNGSCIDYNETSGKFSLDLSETAGALVPDNSTNSDKLDGQHGSHYRIDVYDVNGTVVN